jgi:hypothetical protein
LLEPNIQWSDPSVTSLLALIALLPRIHANYIYKPNANPLVTIFLKPTQL